MSGDTTAFHADEPIHSRDADLLGRSAFADRIADEVLRSPASRGFVIAVTGEWGSGKTSVLKLVEEAVKDKAVPLWFNPWLFSNSEELVSRFFAELATQMAGYQDHELADLSRRLAAYGRALAPLAQVLVPGIGTIVSGVAEAAVSAADTSAKSTRDRYLELADDLQKSERRFVVFIDDIDRLQSQEVGEVMRLVKLVGDLPNAVYVLAYDRSRVERALGEADPRQGRAYLEKIVQVPHTLPHLRGDVLYRIALDELQAVLGDRDLPFFDDEAWAEIFRSAIAPMIETLRDARRYANVAPLMIDMVGAEVAAQDLLALEALRVFEPDVHSALPDVRPILMGESGGIGSQDTIDDDRRETISGVLRTARHAEAAEALLRHLFPAAGQYLGGSREEPAKRSWRLARRVASPDVFDVYLHASFGEQAIATSEILAIVAALADGQRLRELLAQVPDDRLNELLDRVQDYGETFSAEDAAAADAFVGLMPRLRLGLRWSLFPPEWALKGLLRQLVRAAPASDRASIVERLFAEAPSPTTRWYLLMWFGDSEEPDDRELRVLSAETTQVYRGQLRDEILQADVQILIAEPRLLTLLGVAVRSDDDEESRELLRGRLADDSLFEALLVNSMQYADWWPGLIRLVGETFLAERILDLSNVHRTASAPEDLSAALDRAVKRVQGDDQHGLDW